MKHLLCDNVRISLALGCCKVGYLNVSLSSTQTAESRVAATVAERGVVYSSETSPKQSPGPFKFTLMFTPCLLSKTFKNSRNAYSIKPHDSGYEARWSVPGA